MTQKATIPIILFISILYLNLLLTGCYHYPSDCDEIKFNDPIERVADSIKTFEKIIFHSHKKKDAAITNFYVDHHGNFIINNRKVWGWEGIKNDFSIVSNIPELNGYSLREQQRLINLLMFLMRNEISGGYVHYSGNYFDFSYKELGDNGCSGEHVFRSIYVKDSKTSHSSDSNNTIFDEKSGIVLYGPNLDLLE